LNQFPDVEADSSVGRRHFPITIGRRASSVIYGLFLFAAHMSIVLGILLGHLPGTCLIGLIGLAMAIPAFVGAYRHAEDLERLAPFLALNVIMNIVVPVLVAVGLFLG
jgi:1,4-dihydroxy-2-naphthoate octaprenyltransferase